MEKHEDGFGSYILLGGEGYSRHISKVSILSANSKRTKQLPQKPCLWVNKKTDDARGGAKQSVKGLVWSKKKIGHEGTTDAHAITLTNAHRGVLEVVVLEYPIEL